MPIYSKQFVRPEYYDHDIQSKDGKIGTIRVKPVAVLWKPSKVQKFYSVSLDQFEKWIMDPATNAVRRKD